MWGHNTQLLPYWDSFPTTENFQCKYCTMKQWYCSQINYSQNLSKSCHLMAWLWLFRTPGQAEATTVPSPWPGLAWPVWAQLGSAHGLRPGPDSNHGCKGGWIMSRGLEHGSTNIQKSIFCLSQNLLAGGSMPVIVRNCLAIFTKFFWCQIEQITKSFSGYIHPTDVHYVHLIM